MNIKALTPSNRPVRIVQFYAKPDGVFAIIIDQDGEISSLPAERLTVTDREFL